MNHVINEDGVEEMRFSNVLFKDLLVSDAPSISIAKIELAGENEKSKNTVSDTYYYVVEGEGAFIIGDKRYSVSKGSLVCIPKNTIYQDSGNLKMIAISVPKFDTDKVEIIK